MEMTFERTPKDLKETRGREPKYPFKDLKKGYTLKIMLNDEKDLSRIKSAFYQFRKYNKLDWKVRVQIVDSAVLIHRLND